MRTFIAILVSLAAGVADAADGALRVAWPGPIYAFAHPYTRDEGGGVRDAVYDSMTRVTREGTLEPGLAVSWELQSPVSWIFRLRPGVVFSNGEPFDADAVVRNFRTLRAPGATAELPRSAELATVSEITAIDPLTVEIRTKTPDPLLPRRLNMIVMVAPTAWDEMGVDKFIREPVGTGPYRITSWRGGGSGFTLEALTGTWRRAKDVKRVEVTVVTDPAQRIRALMAEQIDVAGGLAPDDMESLKAAGFQIRVASVNSVLSIAYRNVRDDPSPLKDARVRRALNYAVDKQAIVEQILLGTARVATQGSPFGMPGHDPAIQPYPHDPAKAKALLAEAGYPNGFSMVISVYGGALPNDTLIFQKMGQDLAAIGVKAEIRSMAFTDYVRRLFANDWQGIDAFSNGWLGSGLGDPIRAVDQFSCAFPAKFFCVPEVMPTIDATRSEMDPMKREALMRAVMRELNDVGVALWLVEFPTVTGLAPHVQNYDTREASILYENITFSPKK